MQQIPTYKGRGVSVIAMFIADSSTKVPTLTPTLSRDGLIPMRCTHRVNQPVI